MTSCPWTKPPPNTVLDGTSTNTVPYQYNTVKTLRTDGTGQPSAPPYASAVGTVAVVGTLCAGHTAASPPPKIAPLRVKASKGGPPKAAELELGPRHRHRRSWVHSPPIGCSASLSPYKNEIN